MRPIFFGVTPSPHRQYLFDAFQRLRDRYPRVVIPCVGAFSVPTIAIDAGYDPANVHMSDISLFSSVVGLHATGQDPKQLKVKIHHDELDAVKPMLRRKAECARAVLYAMKWARTSDGSYFEAIQREEIEQGQTDVLDSFQAQLVRLSEKLDGAHYEVADMFDVIEQNRGRDDTILVVNAPIYSGDYAKMFDWSDVLTWDEPEIEQFDPATQGDALLHTLVGENAAMVMAYYYSTDPPLKPWLKPHAVFARYVSASRVEYLLGNRVDELPPKRVVTPKETAIKAPDLPIIPPDHEITDKSVMAIVPTSTEVGMYMKDLLAHRLGSAKSEYYFLPVIDGYVFGVFSLHAANLFQGQSQHFEETFGMTCPHRFYKLGKLMVMALVSHEFEQVACGGLKMGFRQPKGVATTCFTPYREVKTNRGVMKLVSREPDKKTGEWRIRYVGDWRKWTYADALASWLAKERKRLDG